MISKGTILFGQYYPRDSFLHRADTRVKAIPVLLVMILALLSDSILFYLVILASVFAGLLFSGVSITSLLNNFRIVLVVIIVTLSYHLIFSAGNDSLVYFHVFGHPVTSKALLTGVYYSMRLLLFLGVTYMITLTSSPSEIAESVVNILRPLKRIGIPVNDLGLVLFIAIRFIFTI